MYVEGEQLYLRSKQERFERAVDEFREIWENDKVEELALQTSGSTGIPQVICAAKAQLRASANRTISALNLPEGTRALLCLPIVYVAGKNDSGARMGRQMGTPMCGAFITPFCGLV